MPDQILLPRHRAILHLPRIRTVPNRRSQLQPEARARGPFKLGGGGRACDVLFALELAHSMPRMRTDVLESPPDCHKLQAAFPDLHVFCF